MGVLREKIAVTKAVKGVESESSFQVSDDPGQQQHLDRHHRHHHETKQHSMITHHIYLSCTKVAQAR